jgi:hypothetical protein
MLTIKHVATCYTNIGNEYDKALDYFSKSFEIYKLSLKPNHPSIATSYNNIDGVYTNKGGNN